MGGDTGEDCATIKYSSTGVPLWTNYYNGPGNADDGIVAVAVDHSDAVIVTGYSDGFQGNRDYLTIKYSAAGSPLWTNRYDGPWGGSDQAASLVVDADDSVIVTGSSAGTEGNQDYATLKYSSAGVPLWTNRYNGPGNHHDSAYGVALCESNSVVVTGAADIGGEHVYNFLTFKYSADGVPLWTNQYGGPYNFGSANAVAVDSSNNVVVTGLVLDDQARFNYATVKYSSSGLPLWTNQYDGPAHQDDGPRALVVDHANNVIVTGASEGGSPFISYYATLKYSPAGVPLWTNLYIGPVNGSDAPTAVGVDGNDNVFVTGYSDGGDFDYAYLTIKYSATGAALWTNRFTGPSGRGNYANALTIDHDGNVLVTGSSLDLESASDFATIKYVSLRPPWFASLVKPNGVFQMQINDVVVPGFLVIEYSTNLSNWTPIFTNTFPTNVVFYADPVPSGGGARFYRAFQHPLL